MSLYSKINQDIHNPDNQFNLFLLAVLNSLYFAFQMELIGRKHFLLKEHKAIELIKKQIENSRKLIELYKPINQSDLVQLEERKIQILSSYLPQPVSREHIQQQITSTFQRLNPAGPADMSRVMGVIMKNLKNDNVDGSYVAQLVEQALKNI